MKKEELDRIKKLCDAASAGPWKSYIEGRDHTSGSNFIMVRGDESRADDIELIGATNADQDFIASARQDVPALIAEVKKLKAKLRKQKRK